MIVNLLYQFLCQHMVDRNKISRSQITMDIFRFMYFCCFPNHRQDLVRNWQYEQQVSDKKQELLIIREDSGFTPCIFVGSVLLIILVICVVFFCFVCLCPVSCVPDVATVSGLSIPDCPFGFLLRLFYIPSSINEIINKL